MYIIFVGFWILLNGRFTVEILVFGLVISAVMYLFICKFLGYSVHKDICLLKSTGILIWYILVLLKEIVEANIKVLKFVYSPKYVPEPAIYYFKTDLKSGFAKVLFANSITLTPGTVTVSVHDDEFCVHALDISLAEGIEEGGFVHILRKMEGMW
ncbi:MAG: Na+/H+ antiporter subunit E [Lachnospiraceae bacterium]|nr:Na+/H+ antiporter subunit E [Lachnospiraceae bacterium]